MVIPIRSVVLPSSVQLALPLLIPARVLPDVGGGGFAVQS